jgi:hypothetical protein
MGCFQWVDSKNGLCGAVATKDGMCAEHFDAMMTETTPEPVPSAVTRWTHQSIKVHLGQVGSTVNGNREYVGGSDNEPHVHCYGNNCAHAKIGNDSFYFLHKPNGAFDEGEWYGGVDACKRRKQPKVLLAMAIVLAQSGGSGLSDQQIDKYIKELRVD